MGVGGGCDDDVEEGMDDVPFDEVSNFPVHDPQSVVEMALQQHDLQSLQSKRRLSYSDKQIKNLDHAYGAMLKQDFAKTASTSNLLGMNFKDAHQDMLVLLGHTISLMKKQTAKDENEEDDVNSVIAQSADEDQTPELVSLPLALQGPAAVAWQLITDAKCTEEQIDAVALLALSLQKRFDARPDKNTHFLPVATAENNRQGPHFDSSRGAPRGHIFRRIRICSSCAIQPCSSKSGPTRQNSTYSKWSGDDKFAPDSEAAARSKISEKDAPSHRKLGNRRHRRAGMCSRTPSPR